MIKLYNFARGIRGVRLFWLCEEMNLPYQTVVVNYPPSEAYLAINPLGNVPCLEDEGVAINESVAILLYLAQKYGPTPLLPNIDDPRLAKVLQLTVFSEAELGSSLNALLGTRFAAPESDKQNWQVSMHESVVKRDLAYLVQQLGDRDYLVGDSLTLADLAISTALGLWSGALKQDLPEALVRYRAHLSERPAYQRALAA